MNKRPITVTLLGWLFVCVGIASMARAVVRLWDDVASGTTTEGFFWAFGSGTLAALGGAFLLRGSNWARWLCAAWMGAHVVLSLWHPPTELVVHALFLAAMVALLWRLASSAYFESD